MKKYLGILLFFLTFAIQAAVPPGGFKIAVIKYKGGGDWYANPTALPNLVKFINKNLRTTIDEAVATVDVGSSEIFDYPFVHMTGHGNVVFNGDDVTNLRMYLLSGGFLHISDNYGMDMYVRREMKKVFPELEWIEVPFDHPIYHGTYEFSKGLPKIHEHDNKPPKGLGLFFEGRLVCFYDFECDLGDGWEDTAVHNDSEQNRLNALKMGANLVEYAFTKGN
ncbi:MAG: DUF4159 domain-containing protein [Bacteroidetes bacterium]|nr:DUF4159 domain-containing protein [Bacteroidota bacterium]